jgi:hypothetical protein
MGVVYDHQFASSSHRSQFLLHESEHEYCNHI